MSKSLACLLVHPLLGGVKTEGVHFMSAIATANTASDADGGRHRVSSPLSTPLSSRLCGCGSSRLSRPRSRVLVLEAGLSGLPLLVE